MILFHKFPDGTANTPNTLMDDYLLWMQAIACQNIHRHGMCDLHRQQYATLVRTPHNYEPNVALSFCVPSESVTGKLQTSDNITYVVARSRKYFETES